MHIAGKFETNCDVIKPGRLWSLLEMTNNFFFEHVRQLLCELERNISVSKKNMEFLATLNTNDKHIAESHPKQLEAKQQSIESITFCIDKSHLHFSSLKCQHIDDATRCLMYWVKDPSQWSELNTRARALRDVITTELKQYLYYQYPRQKGDTLRSFSNEWKAIIIAFPEVAQDAFDATDCYALGQNIASVFHSMRVAEYGLRALAKERNVKLPKDKLLDWATWQEIIKGLDDAIRIIGSKPAGPAKDGELVFYSGARADLNGFKDEYRNLVMHVRATYDEYQALRALMKVHAFMERLTTKMGTSNTI